MGVFKLCRCSDVNCRVNYCLVIHGFKFLLFLLNYYYYYDQGLNISNNCNLLVKQFFPLVMVHISSSM